MPVGAHEGTAWDFLRRHERAATKAARQGLGAIREMGPDLLGRLADTRNLWCAWQYLAHHGGAAPGPDGLTYQDLERHEVRETCRTLSRAILEGHYHPGPDRKVQIPKRDGRTRPLRLQSIVDRVAQRAFVQIIQPLLDPHFDDRSHGYRPHRDRQHALAQADWLAGHGNRYCWVTEDIRDAFEHVPHGRLLDLLARTLPGDLLQRIERVIHNSTKRGLRQGGPLSPLLLNVYLDHLLDRVWRKQHPDLPLIRVADDLLVLCSSREEAQQAREELHRILLPTGMQLKHQEATAIRDLGGGMKAEWLGYEVRAAGEELEVRTGERAWEKLAEHLELAHEQPGAPLVAHEVVRGWGGQLGPTYPWHERREVWKRVVMLARQWGFDEPPSFRAFRASWQRAFARYGRLRNRVVRKLVAGVEVQAVVA
jgi:group II intron reverse transcriptase/maturase